MSQPSRPFRIGNMAAARSDDPGAMAELLSTGDLDVLAVDILSDEAMLALAADRAAGRPAYEESLLAQLEGCLDRLGEGGVRIVTNAGGLDPAGLAAAVAGLGRSHGRELAVAHLDPGDAGHALADLDLEGAAVATIRLGAFGIARALEAGADIVITGRVSREALVTGTAAWFHGWSPTYLDALAGSVAIGHVLSGGPGATGVTDTSTDLTRGSATGAGAFPIAEIDAEGGCVVTKHPSALGSVTVGTLTDQLLDGVAGARYLAPDVVLRLDSVRLEQEGTDRVRLSGAQGELPPPNVSVIAVYADADGRARSRAGRPLPQAEAGHVVVLPDGRAEEIPPPLRTADPGPAESAVTLQDMLRPGGRPQRSMLGSIAGVQSGAVGRGVNLAVWTWDDSALVWLVDELTVDRLRELLPIAADARVERFVLPNLRAVNFVVIPPREGAGDPVGEPAGHAGGEQDLAAALRVATLEIPAELLEVAP